MQGSTMHNYIEKVLENMPAGWLSTTTHRLDIYEEELAKTEFLQEFEKLYKNNDYSSSSLSKLPTAYDYIRLGHPLSCVLEWAIAKQNNLKPDDVIGFSSKVMPVLAILRKNRLDNKNTQIVYTDELPTLFDAEILRRVYGYHFELNRVEVAHIPDYNGNTVFISSQNKMGVAKLTPNVDFFVGLHADLGSVIMVNGEKNRNHIAEIQHVRRRESIAMTPANCLVALKMLIGKETADAQKSDEAANHVLVQDAIKRITGAHTKALVASSGLSMQYAIMMGLIHDALEKHPDKPIKFLVPPNCYGGTNDQSRRVAASIDQVEIVDLPVDGDNDMVQSIDRMLDAVAREDAVPYIIAEIPTNPRVEVPNLEALEATLRKERRTSAGALAVDPVFVLDQTFCPNVRFLGRGEVLSTMRALSYVSGSKFPSGGLCTAGYCVGNEKTEDLMEKIEKHLIGCDNEATSLQIAILAKQLPSMNQRIADAYQNTRKFVDFIHEVLPAAKINFVSEDLAARGFTPSVFSLDLPTKGNTDLERESYKRELNHKLIYLMITHIPDECRFCVSYGQLSGSYWTIPATSTQGTTKEGDKDYIVRVSLSPDMDLERHQQTFLDFVEGHYKQV